MTVVVEKCENDKYYINMEIQTRTHGSVYVVQTLPRISGNLCGYPLNKMEYPIDDKKKAYATYRRYKKKYLG